MNDNQQTFGTWLREKRVQSQMSLRELAFQLDISPSYLAKVERNEETALVLTKIELACSILNADPVEAFRYAYVHRCHHCGAKLKQ